MRKPSSLDGSLGSRIRARRKSIGITQAELATAIGVSFQQVQKYEKGMSAIAASRLEQICGILNLPSTFFTDTDPELIGKPASPPENPMASEEARRATVERFLQSGEGRRLVSSFMGIADQKLRTKVLDFIVSIADDNGP